MTEMTEQNTDKIEHVCDRCDASFFCYPEETQRLGLGCDCGGAWIAMTRIETQRMIEQFVAENPDYRPAS